MWWNKAYVNRRDWILDNLGVLKLTPLQTVVLLMIDFLNQQNDPITLEVLSERTGIEMNKIDELIHDLVRQELLTIKVEGMGLEFCIDGVFQEGVVYDYVDQGIFEVFETEFGRLLSQHELVMLNGWLSKYSEENILDALRAAIIYKKVSMNYINSILVNNEKEKTV
ncbi:DnaD domain protein [Erysipelothrix inopinata]|uniref:DnaD domain protein n=1 Tax=Erysipelothrix inopinata TaxID=225084 RepID=A0A7G9RYP4_9FIRM|nr:DnaD domain protein [Erysipelothrix inopinata]QNN60719.1 DnaD domain protein [Erysipelothrix inopinata]